MGSYLRVATFKEKDGGLELIEDEVEGLHDRQCDMRDILTGSRQKFDVPWYYRGFPESVDETDIDWYASDWYTSTYATMDELLSNTVLKETLEEDDYNKLLALKESGITHLMMFAD